MNWKMTMFAFAALALLSGAAGAQYSGALSLVNVTVSPNPVIAGGNVNITFQIYNSYGSWVYNTNLQPTGSYPLLNSSPLSSYSLGTINPGAETKYYSVSFPVPKNIPSGVYTLHFNATYFVYGGQGTAVATSSMPVSFYVQNRPTITVIASSPSPSTLYTGRNQTVSLVVENTGYGTARNVSVTVTGEQGLNILSSVTSFFIANLTQGSSVSEPVLVSAQGVDSAYVLTNITYYSLNLEQRYNSVQRVNLSVAPSVQFSINSTGTSPGVGATDVPVSFRLTNTGTSAAQELQVSLESSYPITPVASTAYVASLAPGASTNVTFLVDTDTHGTPGNYPVTLTEQWKQPNGAVSQQFTGSNNYFITVASPNAGISDLETGAVVIIVLALIGFMVYRRRKAKKPAAKSKKNSEG